jgi:sugar phosphate isomerase/epimerase
MKCSVTVSLIPEARGGPFVFWDSLETACRHAAELGFHGIEIFAPNVDVLSREQVGSLLKQHSLSLAAMGTGGGWITRKLTLTHSDPLIREEGKRFVESIIDFAGGFGAPAIIGSMQGRWGEGVSREETLQRLRDALNHLGNYAQRHAVPLLYEPLNRYETNLLTRLDESIEFLKTLSTSNVKLLADLFHMNIEEANLPSAIRQASSQIGHVHFVDSNRRPAGSGHLDYRPLAEALREIDYRGFLSAEAFPYPDSLTAAQQTITTFRAFFGCD